MADPVIACFAKHLQALPIEEACERLRAAGFDGLDLTVRSGGYVDPGSCNDATSRASFRRAFASAVKTVRSFGLQVPLVTTGIIAASDPAAEVTMSAAAELGVRELKLHYWPWRAGEPFATALDRARVELRGLAKLASNAGARINLHNHSGDYVTHSAGAVMRLLADHDRAVVGAYLDPAHFTLEGGLAGWRSSIETLLPRATLLAVKDFRWVDVGPGPQERRWVPVGTGNVPWRDVLSVLGSAGVACPISIHGEYQGRWTWRELDAGGVLEQCAADRDWLLGNH